jgi:hypothetical protein
MNVSGGLLVVLLASNVLALPSTAWAGQTSAAPNGDPTSGDPKSQPEEPATSSGEIPVSLRRIRRALSSTPTLKVLEPVEVREGRPVFRVDVEGEKIDVQAILGRDFLRGPVSYGGMTHQEFLDLVTPNDVKGYAAFSNGQGMVVAATSIALQWAVLKAIDTFKKAKDTREREQAREEVKDALEALRKARRAAGLEEK